MAFKEKMSHESLLEQGSYFYQGGGWKPWTGSQGLKIHLIISLGSFSAADNHTAQYKCSFSSN